MKSKIAKMASAILAITVVMAVLPAYAGVPIPYGISGIVYMSNGVTQAPWGTNFSVNDTASGDYIEGTTGAGPHSGWYSVSINGTDGDLVIIKAWNATHYGITTVTLAGDMSGIDVIINIPLADTTPPASITNLQNVTGQTWINWTWNDPTDADFNYTMVYLDGVWKTSTSDSFYTATGLVPDTYYEIGTHTVDKVENINTTWVNQTTETKAVPDTTPPASITNLRNVTGQTWINWTWTNPQDADFNYTMVYLDGVWKTNTSKPFYNATGLVPDTYYEIGTRTVDKVGNINVTGVNQTAKTKAVPDTTPPASITNLQNVTGQTWINWTWNNPPDADFNYTMVYLNGTWQTNTSNPFYNATGLAPDTYYEIGTHTVDKVGNINATWVNQTTKTQAVPDTTPPASITNLQNVTGQTWINWTWNNPPDADFNYTMVFLNGTRQTNTSAPFYNATGLAPDTSYEIGTHTVDDVGNINTTWVNQTTKTQAVPDTTPPASITNLQNVTGQTWINWTWTNPPDADFNYTMVYLDRTWKTNTSDPFYNATGLAPDTHYEIATHTVDNAGNINTTWVNQTTKTRAVPDTTPPASITNLQNVTGQTWINWTWNNPPDADFNYTMVYLDGVWKTNTSDPFYNATGLAPDTYYEIGTHTVDTEGNINATWVNQTTKTRAVPDTTPPASITNLQNVTGQTWINWAWNNPPDADFNYTMVYLDGTWKTNTSDPFYNATGLAPDTYYEIGTHTVDKVGNINTTWVNQTTKTKAVPDTTPPVITNVTATGITMNSAIISWDTDELSDSMVKYGTVPGSYVLTAYDAIDVISHSISLTGLSANTTYYYVVNSTDQSGNSNESIEYSFTTSAAPAVIPANVVIKPETLNLKSKGKFTAFITLPEGYDVADIDISTVGCEGAPAVKGMVADDNRYIAKFNIQDLVGVEPGDAVTLTVTGKLYDKTPFEGSDTIRVIDKGGKE